MGSSNSGPSLPEQAASERRPRRALRDLWSRLSLTNLQIILVVLTVIGGRLIVDFGQRIFEGQTKIAQERVLEAQIEALTTEQQQLEAAKIYYSSPPYIDTWAHGDGKMIRPGETIVVPIYKGQPRPRPSQALPQPPRPLPKWYIWWAMFLDSPPPANWIGDISLAQ